MEPRFGNDFSSVRIHTGSNAVQMNKELHAQAFTHGSDLYFNEGKYNPGSNSGKQLLAHELTHVVQQTGAKKLQRKSITSLRSNKETLQAKISSASSAAIQLKESPGSPQADPAFQAVVKRTSAEAAKQKAHPPAKKKSDEAQAAAQPPANEVESKAQDKQVQEMNQQQPGKFSAEAFKAALSQKIEAATPQTLEEADKFKDNNRLDSVKGETSSKVTEEKKQASGPIEEKAKQPPNPSGIAPKPVTPLPPKEAGSKPGDIGTQGAAPKPKDAAEVSLEAESKKLDQQMTQANVTEEQLEKSNEPEFKSALGAKKDAQTNAVTAPQEYRQKEQATLTQAQAQAQTTAQTQLEGMHGGKEQLLAQVLGKQGEAKGQDEQKRAEVASKINGFYEKTKSDVETILNNLDKQVIGKFDAGAVAAKQKFETFVAPHMETYKERYDGLFGAGRWLKDKLLGVPPEVTAFFKEGRELYLAEMDKTINDIATHVATQLNQAKQKITEGKQQIHDYVVKLPENLRQVGQEAAQDIGGKFDELEQSVDNKQNELVDSLAQKYNENLQQLDAQLEEMKASNRTWMDKAMDAVGGAIKTIVELKNLLLGVLAKAAGAIEMIIKDPIGFLGNLVSGLKQGFENFMGNILEHLKKGMLGWLTGAMAGAGITMPESLDMKGIFSLVTQVLGTVYENIRPRAVKRMGEKAVNFLESNFEMFVILKNEGIAGLWQSIQDQIGDLKVMVIDNIQNFVVDGIIKGGVMWVLSLLNPASAFVKACKAIYDIIMFFIERGSQIAELVNAVMESVTAIASGAVGGAAKLVENALSKALPVVISFMASLLGLGGISEKIQAIVQKVRQPIEKAIDWVIGKAVAFAKKIGGKLGFGKDKKSNKDDGKPDERTLEQKEADVHNAAVDAERIMEQQGATPDTDTVKEKLSELESNYRLKSAKLLRDSDSAYYVEVEINPKEKTKKRKFSELEKQKALDKFGYEISGKKGNVQKPSKAISNNVTDKPTDKEEICYIANVPTIASGKSPDDIAQLYLAQGFKSPDEAKKRLGLVVGVNAYDSITQESSKNKQDLEEKVKDNGWSHFRLGVLGFLWQAKWKKTGGDEANLDQVRSAYKLLTAQEQEDVKKYEKTQLNDILPYDGFRETIKNHSLAARFRKELGAGGNEVYVLIADPDAVSLNPPPNKKQGDGEIPVQEMSTALFERYDKIIKEHTSKNGTPPAIVSGGYEFRMKDVGGQTQDALRAAANKLDMAIRQAMAKVNPFTVYFPEPNTIVRVLPGKDTIEASFTSTEGSSEGQALVRKLREKRKLTSKDAVFDLNAAIETNSDRFTVITGGKEAQIKINWVGGEIKELTAKHIKALFDNSQTHAKKNYWIRRVMSVYPGGKQIVKGRGIAITDIYEHYFPNELLGYEPRELKEKLKTYTSLPGYGEGALGKETKKNLQDTGDYDSVIKIAQEAGEAAQKLLIEILGIE
jgi:hypothetical protein